jgi:vacuolar-type H+-ATPase subunit I/STV1
MRVTIGTQSAISHKPIEFFVNEKTNGVTFLAQRLTEEVTKGTAIQQQKNLKRLKKLYKGFVLLLGVRAVITPLTASASTTSTSTTVAGLTAQSLTPALALHWGLTVSLMVVALGIAVSSSLLAIAGIYRMFRKREEATEWTTDIVKGLVQVLIAVPVTYLLFYLAQVVFKSLGVLSGLF